MSGHTLPNPHGHTIGLVELIYIRIDEPPPPTPQLIEFTPVRAAGAIDACAFMLIGSEGTQGDPMSRYTALALALLAAALAVPASAATITYTTALDPEATGATGTGTASVTFDDATNMLQIVATFSGLSGTTTVAHIHCCTANPGVGTVGVAVTPGTLPGFPVGVTSGAYTGTVAMLDSASYTTTFLNNFGGGTTAGALAALLAGMDAGTAYFNVHSTTFPGGEIRGFVSRVPEPGTLLLLGAGLLGLGLARWRPAK